MSNNCFGIRFSPRGLFNLACAYIVFLLLAAMESRTFGDDANSKVAKSTIKAERLFTIKVLPLLKTKCFGCHGDDPKDVKGEYDLRDRAGMLKGGESEEASLIPGNPEESPLYLAIKWDGMEMPPKENDRLTPKEIEMVRRWIAAGAPWPDEKSQEKYRNEYNSEKVNEDGILASTSGGLSAEWTNRRYKPDEVWAFKPVKEVKPPNQNDHPIDAFVQQKLKQNGFKPAPRADRLTLLRRATYDLTGLPPTPDEVQQFLNDNTPDAWSKLVNRLLESPHYGERWGQHWLDVSRYADTGGFSNDYERSNGWRYRDYVVRSLNSDKPFNQFIIEQIAGDEWKPDDPEMTIATGYLRLGPWGTAMVLDRYARQIFLDDLVNHVGVTFLSTGLRCAKCHDHKFDPIPTRDYYRLYAAFAATQPAEMPAAFLKSENQKGFQQNKQHVAALLKFADDDRKRCVEKREKAARKWFKEQKLAYVSAEKRSQLPDDKKPPRHVGLDYVDEGTLKIREQDVWIWTRRLERFQPMAQSVYNGPDIKQNARKLRRPKKINAKWRPESFIHSGGSLDAPGEKVTPGVLSALGVPVEGASGNDPSAVPEELTGRRLALAKWIADPKNSLSTRSIVNRVWQHHFGQGIVGTPNNFGAKGAKPTHPELLDWLTENFVSHGWKLKRLHRLIMTSEIYQQAASHDAIDQLKVKDPDNHLLAYFPPRRLTAEELRDSLLAISGELNREVGGLPVMPEINMEVALEPRMIQFSLAPAYQPSRTPEERNRRTIYAYRVRGQADPFLNILNQPNPNESCEMRDSAAVTPQAFTLMNSDVMTDRSIAFALRLQQDAGTLEGQIKRAFRLVYGREAAPDEINRLSAYVQEMRTHHQEHQPEPVKYPTRITRSLVEELSGKPFEYTEWLRVFENYVADKKPADVSAETRALADLCLLLFNSNEFIYVY